MKTCPLCAEEIQDAAIVCRYCGAQAQPVGWTPSPSTAPPASTNGLAIASLVLGIVHMGGIGSILALVFGYRARRQIDASGGAQGGRGLAIAGIVLGWIGLPLAVLFWVIFAIGLTTDEDDLFARLDDFPGVDLYIEDLDRGDCFVQLEDDIVDLVSCDDAHDGEITGTVDLGVGPYPGDAVVQDRSHQECRLVFESYTGEPEDTSAYRSDFVWPGRDFWEDGDQEAVCYLTAKVGELVGSKAR